MKLVAVILVLLGLGNLAGTFDREAKWWVSALAALIGISLIAVATGILKKKRFAWPLGFVVIVLGALYFVLESFSFAEGKEEIERSVLLSACGVGALLVAFYWSRIWYRQRSYFIDEKSA